MKCPRCDLPNMPGSVACAQCGASLTEAPKKASYYPARAAERGDVLAGLERAAPPRRWPAGLRLFAFALGGLIPGLLQAPGRRIPAACVATLLLVLNIALWRRPEWVAAHLVLVGVSWASSADALMRALGERARWVASGLLAGAVVLGLHAALMGLALAAWSPATLRGAVGELEAGDVVLFFDEPLAIGDVSVCGVSACEILGLPGQANGDAVLEPEQYRVAIHERELRTNAPRTTLQVLTRDEILGRAAVVIWPPERRRSLPCKGC